MHVCPSLSIGLGLSHLPDTETESTWTKRSPLLLHTSLGNVSISNV